MALLESVILRGTRAAQPAATAVATGTVYCVTNESNIIERSNGTAWQAYSPAAGGGGTTVTNYVIMAAEDGEPGDIGPPGPASAAAGSVSKLVQVVNVQTGAVATGTTLIPVDDTIPQNTEGDEYMTLAITPTSATNKLKIDVVVIASVATASRWTSAALFQDTTAGSLAANAFFMATAGGVSTVVFTHYMTAGTTSATTFKVRAGTNAAGTLTLNGASSARLFGGVFASSITISEIVP